MGLEVSAKPVTPLFLLSVTLRKSKCLTIWTIKSKSHESNSNTRLHPQGKGGPEATFCVRRTKSSQIHVWRILTLYIKFETKSYQLSLCHKFADFWQIERDTKCTEARTHGRTDARTAIFWPSLHKKPLRGKNQIHIKESQLIEHKKPTSIGVDLGNEHCFREMDERFYSICSVLKKPFCFVVLKQGVGSCLTILFRESLFLSLFSGFCLFWACFCCFWTCFVVFELVFVVLGLVLLFLSLFLLKTSFHKRMKEQEPTTWLKKHCDRRLSEGRHACLQWFKIWQIMKRNSRNLAKITKLTHQTW